ncbi:hypothetical protein ABZ446_37135 [Streptomyces sp. NPDC005813]|uniref:hypothetical protein n=1 Tax=Streptomyces sp. NPDC005813 TaxID=3155592 RepID=UPI00340E57AB
MDSTHTALRPVPTGGRTARPYAEAIDDQRGHPPIYAQLVAEWRAEGRGVPERRAIHQVVWASFAAPVPEKDEAEAVASVPAVPVPRGLPGW